MLCILNVVEECPASCRICPADLLIYCSLELLSIRSQLLDNILQSNAMLAKRCFPKLQVLYPGLDLGNVQQAENASCWFAGTIWHIVHCIAFGDAQAPSYSHPQTQQLHIYAIHWSCSNTHQMQPQCAVFSSWPNQMGHILKSDSCNTMWHTFVPEQYWGIQYKCVDLQRNASVQRTHCELEE